MGKASRKKRDRVRRPPDEFLQHLGQQLRFLEKSATDFDAGDDSEFVRMAGHLRILLYDTTSSVSLFEHLGLKRSARFLETAVDLYETSIQPDGTRKTRMALEQSALTVVSVDQNRARHVAPLDSDPERLTRWVSFTAWWTRRVIAPSQRDILGQGFVGRWATRRDLIDWIANTDGGAHVDEGLYPEHDELLRRYHAPIKYSLVDEETGERSDHYSDSPIPAAIRQIAHEVLTTVNQHGLSPTNAVLLGNS